MAQRQTVRRQVRRPHEGSGGDGRRPHTRYFFALVDAVNAFDLDKGFKFTTYLHFPVKNRLRFALGFTTHRRDPLNDCSSLDAPVGESEEETFLDWYCSDPDSDRPFEELADNDLWANARRDIDKSWTKTSQRMSGLLSSANTSGETIIAMFECRKSSACRTPKCGTWKAGR